MLVHVDALVGVYGILSYRVTHRTHEIGIRMAVGAGLRLILSLILRQGMVMAINGTGIGLLGALGSTRLLSNLLFEITVTELSVFVGVPRLLIFIALLACYIPVRRATKVGPLIALKYE